MEHGAQLHGDVRKEHGREVPAPDVLRIVGIHEQDTGEDGARNAGDARRLEAVRQKSFVDHSLSMFSTMKISSVATLKTFANVNASSRLGTYRSRSIEMML